MRIRMCLLFYRIRFASRNVLLLSFKQGHLAYKVFSCLEEKINKTGKTKSTKPKNEKYRINNPQQQNEKYKGGAKNTRHLLFLHHIDGILDMVNQHLSNV